MRVGVIGAGHVGMVTALVLADRGFQVNCLEQDEDVRTALKAGHTHIFEPGLPELLSTVQDSDHLEILSSTADHLADCEVIFVCVNTPIGQDGIDFTQIDVVLEMLANVLCSSKLFQTIAIKSTVIPGTTNGYIRKKLETLSGKRCDVDFGLVSNPEFLREGHGIRDFVEADRIIIGSEEARTTDLMLKVYASWTCEKLVVSRSTSEFIKYYSNVYLANQIAFTNEMANIARQDPSIDFRDVLTGISLDHRLNPMMEGLERVNPQVLSYLVPGPGFGGSCLPKDLAAFVHYASKSAVSHPIIEAIQQTNDAQHLHVVKLIEESLDTFAEKRVLILGIAHKPDTNDCRESAAVQVIQALSGLDCEVVIHDPAASQQGKELSAQSERISFDSQWQERLAWASVIVLMTPWKEYRALTDPSNQSHLDSKIIIDTRYMFRGDEFTQSTYINL